MTLIAQTTTVESMQNTANMYAKRMLESICKDNAHRFINDEHTKNNTPAPGVHTRHLHFPHQSVSLILNTNDNTIKVIVLSGYKDATATASLDDYTPDNNPNDYELCA